MYINNINFNNLTFSGKNVIKIQKKATESLSEIATKLIDIEKKEIRCG